MGHAPSLHDNFFRALMERPKAAGALLRERLPPTIAKQLIGDPVLVDGTFVDENMRKSQSDRLFQVALRGGRSAFIYCLVEHKSAPDPRVALQLLRYLVRVWERLDRQAKGKGLLPPILPLVVYHGEPQWSTPTRFSSMLAATEEMRPHLLDFPFGLLDVGQVEDDKLSNEEELGGADRAQVRLAGVGGEHRGGRRLGTHQAAWGSQRAVPTGGPIYAAGVQAEFGAVRIGIEAGHGRERRRDHRVGRE